MRVFLCGDLMLGRGIDQILAHSAEPTLYEPYVRDAREYVALAERERGSIPRGVGPEYIWGDLPDTLAAQDPDFRIGNLETSITRSPDADRRKSIHYRMSPENVDTLTFAGFDAVTLGNNHVLDWGTAGLTETLDSLRKAGIAACGAGQDDSGAREPCILDTSGGARLVVYAVGDRSSGIPKSWAAGPGRPGVALKAGDRELQDKVGSTASSAPVIVSVHWGENWGYTIPKRQQKIARGLIDRAGVSIVFGHSSHHPKGVEFYHGGLILYGAGDFINDYEGIPGHERYRPNLAVGYLVDVDYDTKRVEQATALVFSRRRFTLELAGRDDVSWLAEVLRRTSPEDGVLCETRGGTALHLSALKQ
jgi:poly-gamma-glutamate synthesis protein (capsule biosynthesis protein)